MPHEPVEARPARGGVAPGLFRGRRAVAHLRHRNQHGALLGPETSGAEPERLTGRRVSPRYFDVYAVRPLVGRTFTPDEERFGGPLAAVISYGLWSRCFGRDSAVTSRRLVIEGRGCAIAGVIPGKFAPPDIDVWLPAQVPPGFMRVREAASGVMKPGISVGRAQPGRCGFRSPAGGRWPPARQGRNRGRRRRWQQRRTER